MEEDRSWIADSTLSTEEWLKKLSESLKRRMGREPGNFEESRRSPPYIEVLPHA